MIVQGIVCNECKTAIWSAYRHDWHTCPCGTWFVDGGRDYLRFGGLKEAPNGMALGVRINTKTLRVTGLPGGQEIDAFDVMVEKHPPIEYITQDEALIMLAEQEGKRK